MNTQTEVCMVMHTLLALGACHCQGLPSLQWPDDCRLVCRSWQKLLLIPWSPSLVTDSSLEELLQQLVHSRLLSPQPLQQTLKLTGQTRRQLSNRLWITPTKCRSTAKLLQLSKQPRKAGKRVSQQLYRSYASQSRYPDRWLKSKPWTLL